MLTEPKASAHFRFYGSLNDFLNKKFRHRTLVYHFNPGQTLKDAIEAMGVPHPEVQMILQDDQPVSFRKALKSSVRIAVYPFFYKFDIPPNFLVNRETHQKLKFILDVHLGKLAKYLRFAGLDTLLFPSLNDNEIVQIGSRENRIILTRDIGVLKHRMVTFGYWLRSQDPKEQFWELIHHFRIGPEDFDPWTRCSICNGPIKKVPKQKIGAYLKPGTRQYFTEFFQCTGCGRVYWKGSHYQKLNAWIEKTIHDLSEKE